MGIGLFGVVVIGGTRLLRLQTQTMQMVEQMGRVEDMRNYMRGSADCVKTIEAQDGICKSGGYVDLYDNTGKIVVNRDFNGKLTKMGHTQAMRAKCTEDSGIYTIEPEYALIRADAKQAHKGTMLTNAVTGHLHDWTPLFPVSPLVCSTWIECSALLYVPARTNPYFSGTPWGTALKYFFKKGNNWDTTANAPPLQANLTDPRCMTSGGELRFSVAGSVTHGGGTPYAPADGSGLAGHVLGAQYGKSNIIAPYSSLLGVFLSSTDPTWAPAPPALDFTTPASRDYTALSPQLGQIFFIGDGRRSDGNIQTVVVPAGATRLFYGIMDSGQWNNNGGGLYGTVLWRP